jgi:hypothetical protein
VLDIFFASPYDFYRSIDVRRDLHCLAEMTGMPSWGVTHEDEMLWDVVSFVRKLELVVAESAVGELLKAGCLNWSAEWTARSEPHVIH